ncbi:hypothetical protein DFQ04_3101 [Algoriphagus boseongensis]|uniref:Uncharacterized protein n=1 Tax=Algoriphagus boseongensis TaxID=1442587 RepID=A0A4R6T5G1_9BACT|nr:hypothetical protein DFQ04_3101 [Algoriphagus boseongensis]
MDNFGLRGFSKVFYQKINHLKENRTRILSEKDKEYTFALSKGNPMEV